jgi:hypothetical protein
MPRAVAPPILAKSVVGAISPWKAQQRAIKAMKLDELPDEERIRFEEMAKSEAEELPRIQKVCRELVTEHQVKRLVAGGLSDQARSIQDWPPSEFDSEGGRVCSRSTPDESISPSFANRSTITDSSAG